ncbi:cupin domain-containing protein [Rhodospirillaceae bacterium SYSU D60014]|uniref:cupin domain-containing protein n=1 Tax=Virgifigura deserti TaxID=2268457 RepID=UPI0013C426DF
MSSAHTRPSILPRIIAEPWGEMCWLIDDALSPGAGVSLAEMILKPGAESPSHRHPNCTEAIHLVAGLVEQAIDEQIYYLRPGETVLVPVGAVHWSRNVGDEEARMTIVYSAGTRLYEAV